MTGVGKHDEEGGGEGFPSLSSTGRPEDQSDSRSVVIGLLLRLDEYFGGWYVALTAFSDIQASVLRPHISCHRTPVLGLILALALVVVFVLRAAIRLRGRCGTSRFRKFGFVS